jgi:tRNA threonylcarbamoyl adenosine modification protein YeaZ
VLLLAFDTATPAVTVALHDGRQVLAEVTTVDARRHGELLAPSIRRVHAAAGVGLDALTAVVTGIGPGPYTGLRVGVMTARALGAALGVPVYGVCTLDAIAHATARPQSPGVPAAAGQPGWAAEPIMPGAAGAGRRSPFLVATDARRKEVYWALYAPDGSRMSGPAVNRPAELPVGGQAAGHGAWLYPQAFGRLLEPRYPAASALAAVAAARLSAGRPMPSAEPIYLRMPDARLPGPPKAVSPR